MSKKTTDENANDRGCGSCGDDRVVLTEERFAVPKCAGCGKPVSRPEDK